MLCLLLGDRAEREETETNLNEAVVLGGADESVGQKMPVLRSVDLVAGVDWHTGDVLVVSVAVEPPVRLGEVLCHHLKCLQSMMLV